MVLASSVPQGVGARQLRSFQSTRSYRHLRVGFVVLLSAHWLVVSAILIGGVHARFDGSNPLPAGPVASLVFGSGFAYIITLPLLAPLLAWSWVRQVRAITASRRVARWVLPAALALYGLHLVYYVPFMTMLD